MNIPIIHRRSGKTPAWKVDDNGCYRWMGAIHPTGGYGRWRQRYAHREVYREVYGAIPVGHEIHHTCGVRDCVRPEHLVAVTRARHLALHGQGRIDAATAGEIRKCAASGELRRETARRFGISRSYVSLIVTGRRLAA